MKIVSHDSDRKDLIGMEVEVLRIVKGPDPEFDPEVLPMVYVVTPYGETVLCYPDELDPIPEEVLSMKDYRVTLHEEPGDIFTFVFDCRADDADHAAEQAENAYPGCQIVNVTEVVP